MIYPNSLPATLLRCIRRQKSLSRRRHVTTRRLVKFGHTLADYPYILEALEAYEAKQDDESLFVFWIDKMTTIPTHFYDNGKNLRQLGITNQADIQRWYATTLQKLHRHGKAPHDSAVQVLEMVYRKMHDELLDA